MDNTYIERNILGSILLDNAHWHSNPGLTVELFSTDIYRRIFRRMAAMFEDAMPVETVSLTAELQKHDECDAGAYVEVLTDGLAQRKSITHWVKFAGEQSRLRQLAAKAEAWTNRITAGDAESKAIAQQIIDEAGMLLRDADADDWRSLFHTYDEFRNAPPLQFAINGFLQEAGITLIGGLSGHGKTLIMLSMARALLDQEPLFGYEQFQVTRPAKRVLYLVPESGIGPFWARIKMFRLEEYVRKDRLLVRTLSSKEEVCLSDPRLLKAAEGADIFLDTAVRFMDGAENDVENAKVFAATLFKLLAAGARTVTGAHHAPKGFETQDYMTLENILRGSGDLGAMLCTAWGVRQIDAEHNRVYVQNVKPRDFQPCQPFVIEGRPHLDDTGYFAMIEEPGMADDMKKYVRRDSGGARSTPAKEGKKRQVAEMHALGLSNREVARSVGISEGGVRKWLKELSSPAN